jgi:hypothetical protein
LSALHLDPEILDHEGLALWTFSCEEIPLEKDVLRAVVYIGHDRTVIAVGRHGQFVSAHGARTGLTSLTGDRVAADNASRQLASRLNQVIAVHTRGTESAPLQWAWTGPGAEQPEAVDLLRAALPASAPTIFTHDRASSFLARALASRALQAGALRCNLRMGALEHPHAADVRRQHHTRVLAGTLVAGVLLCAVNGAWRFTVNQRQDALQASITALARELTQGARVPRGQEVVTVRRMLKERAPQTAPFTESFTPSPRQLLRSVLASAAARHLVLESASLRKDSILLNGHGADWNSCEMLASLLRDEHWRVDLDRRDAGADEQVHFTLRAQR